MSERLSYTHLQQHFDCRLEVERFAWFPIHVGSVAGVSGVSCVETGVDGP